MFKTKFGAWLYKIFNGGGQIEYAKDKEEYYVGQQVQSDKAATYKRVFEGDSSKPSGGIPNAIDYFPTGLAYAGKKYLEQGENIESSGDVITGVGIVVTPIAPYAGPEVIAFGSGVSSFGVGLQVIDIWATNGNSLKAVREIVKKSAVELIPMAAADKVKKVVKKLPISDEEKKILNSIVEGKGYLLEKTAEGGISKIIDNIFDKIERK